MIIPKKYRCHLMVRILNSTVPTGQDKTGNRLRRVISVREYAFKFCTSSNQQYCFESRVVLSKISYYIGRKLRK